MTLQKVQVGQSNPFLRPYEAEIVGKAKIIAEPRTMDTQFGKDQNTLDIELPRDMTEKDYSKQDLDADEIKKRIGTRLRSWIPNGTSWNFLIDKFGDQESKWVDKEVEFEVEKVMIDGKKKKTTYAKGSVKEDDN